MSDDNLNDGGPAFPACIAEIHGRPTNSCEFALPGMSLRDYFAAKALQGWLASFDASSRHPASQGPDAPESEATMRCDGLARMSYDLADAMIRARER